MIDPHNILLVNKTSLHVLFFISRARPGGAQLSTLDLARLLPRHGIQASVCIPDDGLLRKNIEAAGIPHLRLSDKKLNRIGHFMTTLSSRRKVSEYISQNDIKAFICSSLDGAYLLGMPLKKKCAFIYYSRDINSTSKPLCGIIKRYLLKKAIRKADLWLCNSNFIRSLFAPITKRKDGIVIHNGINLEKYLTLPLRKWPADAGRCRHLGMVGTITPIKEHEVLFHGMALLAEKGVDFILHVAGEDPLPGKPLTNKLIRLAAELHITSRIVWHGQVTDVPAFFNMIDLSILTCSREAFGKVLVESMAAGVPVIAPRSGGSLEVVKDGETGRFFNPGSPQSLADTIFRLLSEPDKMNSMAIAGRNDAVQRFSIDKTVTQVAGVLKRICIQKEKETDHTCAE